MRWEIILPEAVVVGSESIRSGIQLPAGNLPQYKSCVRERQLESVEAFILCCYMQTWFDSSVLSPVVGSAVAKSVWVVFRSLVQIPFFLSPKLASIFSIYCHTADELCGSEPLIWFWESTGTVLSYCLNENGCLFYNSAAYWWWVLQVYSTRIVTLLLSNLWPLRIKNKVQLLSPLLSPESSPWSSPEPRVQVL